jgi:hypothetical protein
LGFNVFTDNVLTKINGVCFESNTVGEMELIRYSAFADEGL